MNDLSFEQELSQNTINIPRAALSFARSIAYPALDIQIYLNHLNGLAATARDRVRTPASLVDRIDSLSEYMFYELNFQGARGNGPGNPGDYRNPENSFLNRVIETRMGIPISLAVIYIAVAQRVGLPAYGIGLPGHFIVGFYEDGREIYIDPFNAGVHLSVADCARLVNERSEDDLIFNPKWLSPITPEKLLARMLSNLCNAYIQREEWTNAIPVIHHLLIVQPDVDYHMRDLGYLYMYAGTLRKSAYYLEKYLQLAPAAPDYQHVLSILNVVAGRLALWN